MLRCTQRAIGFNATEVDGERGGSAPRGEDGFDEFFGNGLGDRRVRIVKGAAPELHGRFITLEIGHTIRAHAHVTLELRARIGRQRPSQVIGDEVREFPARHWNIPLFDAGRLTGLHSAESAAAITSAGPAGRGEV